MKFSASLFLPASLFIVIHLSAQNNYNKIDSVAGIFKMLIHKTEKEKISLQTDRKIYTAGEKIWFRAYVVHAVNNQVDPTGRDLFTDLVDDHDNVIAKLVLNNALLNTNGTFTLPDSLVSGFYWIRCYTNKILAEDTESIFVQPVYVLNKRMPDTVNYNRRNAITVKRNSIATPFIRFFPERLTGIPGITSTGVLQITGANNNPVSASGEIVNSNDSAIANFAANRFGLSRITFPDEPNQKYTAVFHTAGGEIKYPLPPVDHFAAQLSVINQTRENIKAFVTLEDSLSPDENTIILGVNRDSLCYAAVGTGTYGVTIPLNNFPGGITSLLLFDRQQHLLSERKIYINKDNYALEIKTNKKNYAARDNATLNIKVTDNNKDPLAAALSISVQDAWLVQLSDSVEINNLPPSDEFLLGNWLRLHQDQYSPADIDLLMADVKSLYAHSINRDSISKKVYNDDDEKILSLIGKITDRRDRPVKDRVITVISKDQNVFFLDVDTTKDDGAFKIPLPQNMDSLSLSLQVTDKHGVIKTDDNITIDNFNFPHFATPASLKQQFLANNINTIALIRKYHVDTAITFQGKGWLKPVTVTAIQKKEPNYDESRRINSISQILAPDKFRYGGYGAVLNALLMIPGITYSNGEISIFGTGVHPNGTVGRPLLVVDGVPAGDAKIEYFMELSPAEIDFIEVLRGGEAAIYGMRGGNGVISVNTRRGPPLIPGGKSNFRVFTPVTYYRCPPFFMPDYSNKEIKNSKTPDPRTTIYWNGNLVTDSNGKAAINFYTADNATNYAITVTGLTAKGDIIYKRIGISRN